MFEIELIIRIKMDLPLDNLQGWYTIKPKHPTNFNKWLNISIWPIDQTLTNSTALHQNGPGSNGNEGILHILQSSRIGASLSGAVLYHTQDTCLVEGGMSYSAGKVPLMYQPQLIGQHTHFKGFFFLIKY